MRTRIQVTAAKTPPREVDFSREHTLSQTLFLAGYFVGLPLCTGIGQCGRCRVKYLTQPPTPVVEERNLFSDSELAAGWRLSCRHVPRQGDRILLPGRGGQMEAVRSESVNRALAVDLGTTTIKWRACRAGGEIESGKTENPQMGGGSEIMSRLALALEHPEQAAFLQEIVRAELQSIAGRQTEEMVIAGNSAMIYLLLGLDTTPLARAPYRLTYQGGEEHPLGPGLPQAYIPPLFSPFVGADVSAGLCALLGREPYPAFPFLLCDMGTNGEFLLALEEDRYLATSVALGPALEGVGLTCGGPAAPGAITQFTVGPDGLSPVDWEGGWFITGTGYLSLLANLKRLGLLDSCGRFQEGRFPLAKKVAAHFSSHASIPRLQLKPGVWVSSTDVEEILKVKAAFNFGFTAILERAGIGSSDLKAVYMAGALGEHAPADDLVELGFVPPQIRERIIPAGNTALAGAWLLLDPAKRGLLKEIRNQVQLVDLTADGKFQNRYVQNMRFEHFVQGPS